MNHTIDDEYGDSLGGGTIQYTPADGWQQGATCGGCFATPEKVLAFDETWQDSTADSGRGSRELTITFNGA